MGVDVLLAHGLQCEDLAVCYGMSAVLFLRSLLKKGRIRPWATERSAHRILQLPGLVVLNAKIPPLCAYNLKMNSFEHFLWKCFYTLP